MIHITHERAVDIAARKALLDRIMPERFEKPSEKLRAGRLPAKGLALVARDGGRILGSVRLWTVFAGSRPALLLGPLAVDAEARSKGIGAGLMQVALARAEEAGHAGVILVGDPEYYERFGFAADPARGLIMPGPVDRRRLLGLEFTRGALAGAEGLVAAAGAPGRALARAA